MIIEDGALHVGQTWRHKKSGHIYRIMTFGLYEPDKTPVVCYQEAEQCSGVWVSPLLEFADGRFERVEI